MLIFAEEAWMLSKRKPSKANVTALRSSQWPGIGIVASDSPVCGLPCKT